MAATGQHGRHAPGGSAVSSVRLTGKLASWLLAVEAWNRTPTALKWLASVLILTFMVVIIAFWYVTVPMICLYYGYRVSWRLHGWWTIRKVK